MTGFSVFLRIPKAVRSFHSFQKHFNTPLEVAGTRREDSRNIGTIGFLVVIIPFWECIIHPTSVWVIETPFTKIPFMFVFCPFLAYMAKKKRFYFCQYSDQYIRNRCPQDKSAYSCRYRFFKDHLKLPLNFFNQIMHISWVPQPKPKRRLLTNCTVCN